MDVALGRRSSKLYLCGNIQPVSSDGRGITVQPIFSLNDSFQQLREEEFPRSIWELVRFRLHLLRLIGWRGWGMYEQHIALLRDVARAVLARVSLRRARLRHSVLVKKLVGTATDGAAPALGSQSSQIDYVRPS